MPISQLPPTPTNKNTLNSVSIDIRDNLLNLNIVPYLDYAQQLTIAIGPKIGLPAKIDYLPTNFPLSDNVVDMGSAYREDIIGSNIFKTDSSIPNQPKEIENVKLETIFGDFSTFANKTWKVYPSSDNTLIQTYGILSKTKYKNYVNDNISKNLYSDSDKQKDIAPLISTDVPSLDPTKVTKGYIDDKGNLMFGNSSGKSTQAADIIGSLVNGQGVGISSSGPVANFDLRSSLAGRVLGATGTISDTKLGMIGGQQLALALANNAAFNLQESILGALNIKENLVSLVKGTGFAGLRPSYKITIPESGLGRFLDATSTILGFSLPRSYMNPYGSIFQSESGNVDNVTRANELIKTTGRGQVLALLSNVMTNRDGTSKDGNDNPSNSTNQFRTGYVPAYFTDNKGNERLTDTEIYAFSQNGLIIDLFDTNDGSGKGNIYTIPNLISNREALVEKDFEDFITKGFNDYEQKDGTNTKKIRHSWLSEEGGVANTRLDGFTYGVPFNSNKKNILRKTQLLFDSNGMKNIVSREGDLGIKSTQIQTANGGGISKGSAVLSKDMYNDNRRYKEVKDKEPEDVYCRAWTTFNRYDNGYKQIRADKIFTDGKFSVPFRYNAENSVLEDNGHVKVVPYTDDNISDHKTDVKKFMFSIENLAWYDDRDSLPKREQGPGDLITGKRGRIMWFPPYDIQFSESSSVEWEPHKFIGRGENIYTYNNTERSGQLSFKIIVDHSTYTNTFRGDDGPDDNYIASFMAGCINPDSVWTDKFTLKDNVQTVTTEIRTPNPKPAAVKEVPPSEMRVYFANDNTEVGPNTKFQVYENPSSPIDYTSNATGEGFGEQPYPGKFTSQTDGKKKVTNSYSYWPDRTNYSLNNGGKFSIETKVGSKTFRGYFNSVNGETFEQAVIKYLKEECKFCKARLVGYASAQGKKSINNNTLSPKRAQFIKDRLVAEAKAQNLPNADSIFIVEQGSKELVANNEVDVIYTYNNKEKKVTVKRSANGCNVCPRKEDGVKGGISAAERKVACPPDTLGCKLDRYVQILFTFDEAAANAAVAQPEDTVTTETKRFKQTIRNKFYNEMLFFDKLKKKNDFIFDKFREKIKHFHPSFHSMTPEGLNQRLTFLLQCTRQGQTKENQSANNLAFGRPPVCILRIGDFYHTKIIIDNISFDYEPLVWDLNPEGIGVQPMIANVNMSFKFIGGESLYGPINRLQNAVSFNFFANTQVFETRSDIITTSAGNGSSPTFELKMGDITKDLDSAVVETSEEIIPEPEVNQEKVVESTALATNQEELPQSNSTEPKITGFKSIVANGISGVDKEAFKIVKFSLKQENIEKKNDDGSYTRLLDDAKFKDFLSKGLKVKLCGPDSANDFIYEEEIKFDNPCCKNGNNSSKDPWSIFGSGYELGETFSDVGSFVVNTKNIKGEYDLTITYEGNKIQTQKVRIGMTKDNGYSSSEQFEFYA